MPFKHGRDAHPTMGARAVSRLFGFEILTQAKERDKGFDYFFT